MLRRSTEKKEKKKNIRLFHKRGDVLEILSSPLLSIKQLRAHGARDEKRLPVFRARVQQKELYVARVSSTIFYILLRDILLISSSGRNFYPQFIEKINDRNDDFERDRFSIRTNASLSYIFPSFPPFESKEKKVETDVRLWTNMEDRCSLAINSSPRVNLTHHLTVRGSR